MPSRSSPLTWMVLALVSASILAGASVFLLDTEGLVGVAVLLGIFGVLVVALAVERVEILWVLYAFSLTLLPVFNLRYSVGTLRVPVVVGIPVLAIVAISLKALLGRNFRFREPKILGCLGLFLVANALSLMQARALEAGLWVLIKFVFHAVLFAFLVSFRDPVWHRYMTCALVLVTGGLSAYGLAMYFAGLAWDVNFYSDIATRTASGLHLALVLPLGLALALSPGFGRTGRLLLWTANGLSLVAITLTYSRSAWMSLLAALVVLAVSQRRNARAVMVGVAVLAAVYLGTFAPTDIQERFWSTFSLEVGAEQHVTNALRVRLQRLAVDQIIAHPVFGVGLGNYPLSIPWYLYNTDMPVANIPHNYYLMVWAEGGVFAILGFVGMMSLIGRRLIAALRDADGLAARWLVGGALGAQVALLTFLLFADDFNNLLVWTVLGIVTSAARISRTPVAAASSAVVRRTRVSQSRAMRIGARA